MYGSRGRIGLMLPYDNAVIEPEFARTLPPGVSAHVVRTTKTDRMELAEESLMLAPTMQQRARTLRSMPAMPAASFRGGRGMMRFSSGSRPPREFRPKALIPP
jgi:hypothetical protein